MSALFKTFGSALLGMVVIAALLLSLGVVVYQAGRTQERLVWVEREANQAKKFASQLDAEVKRGQAASKKSQAAQAVLQASYATLESQYAEVRRRISLVLAPVVPARGVDGQPRASADALAGSQQQPADPGQAQRADGGSDHRLSLAAVWMWNSSLAGADVPAHSCGLADTSSEACAADSGLTVEDVWDNQHVNAKSCASDRLRHRALIEFLTERPAE